MVELVDRVHPPHLDDLEILHSASSSPFAASWLLIIIFTLGKGKKCQVGAERERERISLLAPQERKSLCGFGAQKC